MKLLFFGFLSLGGSALGTAPRAHELTDDYSYEKYIADFRKTDSDNSRRLFHERLAAIRKHNSNPTVRRFTPLPNPLTLPSLNFSSFTSLAQQRKYSMGVNAFTDVPSPPKGRASAPASAAQKAAAVRAQSLEEDPRVAAFLEKSGGALPASVNWAKMPGVVSAVKNQGHCGSCWAFATTAVVESHVALATGNLFSLSPQQLVACAPNDDHCGGYGGCMGSIPELAYDYLIGAGGYAEEWSWGYFSYTGSTNGTCYELDPTPLNSNPIKAGIVSRTRKK